MNSGETPQNPHTWNTQIGHLGTNHNLRISRLFRAGRTTTKRVQIQTIKQPRPTREQHEFYHPSLALGPCDRRVSTRSQLPFVTSGKQKFQFSRREQPGAPGLVRHAGTTTEEVLFSSNPDGDEMSRQQHS